MLSDVIIVTQVDEDYADAWFEHVVEPDEMRFQRELDRQYEAELGILEP